jgi:hypothetical protein
MEMALGTAINWQALDHSTKPAVTKIVFMVVGNCSF